MGVPGHHCRRSHWPAVHVEARRPEASAPGRPLQELLAPYKRSCLAFLLFSFNTVANSSLKFFECVDVAGGRWRVVRSVPDIDCRSDEYSSAVPIFVVCLVAVLLCPLAIAKVLHSKRVLRLAGRTQRKARPSVSSPAQQLTRTPSMLNSLRDLATVEDDDKPLTPEEAKAERIHYHVYGIFFDMFRGEHSYVAHMWNAFVLVRRVLLVAVSVLGFQYGRRTRYAALTIAHLFTLLLHIIFMPYRDLTMKGKYATVPDFVRRIQPQSAEDYHGPRIRVNALESISLLLLTVLSAVVGSMDVPLSTSQAVVLSVMVFAWTGVLVLSIIVRALGRRRAVADKTALGKRTVPGLVGGTSNRALPTASMYVSEPSLARSADEQDAEESATGFGMVTSSSQVREVGVEMVEVGERNESDE